MVESVAVIVPCFNAGETLAETVASARDEAGELVIVDDGSDDPATLGLLAEFEADGLRVVRRRNGGLGPARMTGVESTSAPYVFPLDADDLLVPGALYGLATALDRDPDAAVAWGDLETFGLTSFRMPSAPVLDPWFVTYANLIPVGSLYRREPLLAAGGWPGGLAALEDWMLWLALAEHGRGGVYVPGVVLRYRRRPGSMLMASLSRFDEIHARLREEHPRLFGERPRNRAQAAPPRLVKTLVPVVDRLPFVPRLWKLWAFQVLSLAFWNGGPWLAARLVVRTLSGRLRRHAAGDEMRSA